MVELQVPIAIPAKYDTLTVTRSLKYAHQSPVRKMGEANVPTSCH